MLYTCRLLEILPRRLPSGAAARKLKSNSQGTRGAIREKKRNARFISPSSFARNFHGELETATLTFFGLLEDLSSPRAAKCITCSSQSRVIFRVKEDYLPYFFHFGHFYLFRNSDVYRVSLLQKLWTCSYLIIRQYFRGLKFLFSFYFVLSSQCYTLYQILIIVQSINRKLSHYAD